jgi:hypothetical protein
MTKRIDPDIKALAAAVCAEGGEVSEEEKDGIRCQFCVVVSPRRMWKHGGHQCPNCGKFYDAFLEIDADDE